MKTPLYDLHSAAGARFIQFAEWDMPLHYGSQLEEHHAVRNSAGCFDVSHMAVIDIPHNEGFALLRHALCCDVAQLEVGKGRYTLMLNERGGIVDDLIVYRTPTRFRLVVNAATTAKDLAWLKGLASKGDQSVALNHRSDLCIVAVQGPNAIDCVASTLEISQLATVARFAYTVCNGMFIARTGYTGEDGVEVLCDAQTAVDFWTQLVQRGIKPVGLGARDSLRLEAGLNLYGHDMTDMTNPYECRVAWTIDWSDTNRDFVGKQALEQIRDAGSERKLTGIRLTTRGIPREGYVVQTSAGDGIVTSGTYSPTLACGIALARVPQAASGDCEVHIRNKTLPAKIKRPPFVA